MSIGSVVLAKYGSQRKDEQDLKMVLGLFQTDQTKAPCTHMTAHWGAYNEAHCELHNVKPIRYIPCWGSGFHLNLFVAKQRLSQVF